MPVTVAVWTSIRSASLKLMTPLSLSVAIEVPSVTAPMKSEPASVMVGVSFVPITVTLTVSLTVPPLPSLTVTVKDSVAVWPLARYCADELGRL